MLHPRHLRQFRRIDPRVPIRAFCTEYIGDSQRHSTVVDLSAGGLRVQRPGYYGRRKLQLEFELPDIDEVIWAEGEVCFDDMHDLPAHGPGRSGQLVCTSGIRIVNTATYQRRLMRDYVHYLRNEAAVSRDVEWCSYLPGVSAPRVT